MALQDLADADARGLHGGCRVAAVAEAFGDFEPVDPHHFVVSPAVPAPVATLAAGGSGSGGNASSFAAPPLSSEPHHLLLLPPLAGDYASGGRPRQDRRRPLHGLAFLAAQVQDQAARGSEAVARVAGALHRLAEHDERALFDFGSSDSSYSSSSSSSQQPLLLILDRRDDPVTPLLTQWSYQAMAHELLGLSGGRRSLANAPGVSAAANRDVVLSARTDPFFASHARSSFGDLGGAVRSLVDAAARAAAASRGAAAAADLQGFFESYGDLSAAQAAGGAPRVCRRGAVAPGGAAGADGGLGGGAGAGLRRRGGRRGRRCRRGGGDDRDRRRRRRWKWKRKRSNGLVASHFDAVARLLPDPRPSLQDKLRLLCLFALRHERDGRPQIDELMRRAAAVAGLSPRALAAVPALLRAAGASGGGGGGGGAGAPSSSSALLAPGSATSSATAPRSPAWPPWPGRACEASTTSTRATRRCWCRRWRRR